MGGRGREATVEPTSVEREGEGKKPLKTFEG